jgi:DMSO/TMAO reductase YedYZ molybdopterin-dependent catalytic subunit
MAIHRRRFIRHSLGAGAVLFVGCQPDGGGSDDPDMLQIIPMDGGTPPDGTATDMGGGGGSDGGLSDMAGDMAPDMAPPIECDDAFAGGDLQSVLRWASGGDNPTYHQPLGQGWDGRQYFDLSQLTHDNLLSSNEQFFIRTMYPDTLDPRTTDWSVQINGLVDTPVEFDASELVEVGEPKGAFVLECSGNGDFAQYGLLSAAEWDGVPLLDVIRERTNIDPEAVAVKVSGYDDHSIPSNGGHSTPGAAWVYTFDQIESFGGFLATKMNGVHIPLSHGRPVRMYMPTWYGCSCIKWVNEITLVGPDEPSTSQMIEFASRTHQRGQPRLAKDFLPASMDQAAMPIRIEHYRLDGEDVFRVVGILWGGYAPTEKLEVRFGFDGDWEPVDVCPPMTSNQPWSLWEHAWRPDGPGMYNIRCRIADPFVSQKRLDIGFYDRSVRLG